MITGSPGTFTSVWKKAAMSMGIRTQPCETGASGTSVSPWIANAVPMKNTELYMKPSGTAIQPGKNERVLKLPVGVMATPQPPPGEQ